MTFSIRTIRILLILFCLSSALILRAQEAGSSPEQTPPPGVTIHVVQRGETLYSIALNYGLTIDALVELNGLDNPNNIQVGERLLVPAQPEAAHQTHVVQPGETLRTIADLYGTTVDQLGQWNQLSNLNTIYAGQELVVGVGAPDTAGSMPSTDAAVSTDSAELAPTALPATLIASTINESGQAEYSTLIHTVQRGETLFRIAQQYGVTVNAIMRGNQIADADTIYVGQQLAIPGVQTPQLSAALPAPLTGLEISPLILIEGQTARIRATTSTPVTIRGSLLDQTLYFAGEQDGTLQTALIGVPVGTEPGVYPLTMQVINADGSASDVDINVQVISGGYGRESIRLAEGTDNLLDPATEDAELAILRPLMSPFNAERYFDAAMGLPAAAQITSTFGNSRSYNGGTFSRVHAGVDFAGAPGTPIFAPAPGVVVLADDLNVRGTATVIDHGWGVYTGYWHQSARYVSVGDFVETGEVIGAVGSSGRVTGPHLHWELWVNGVPVDPMQWVQFNFSS
ncbi:MAG: LysM peptidoglycan-binding domain-containing protein [Anaerolineae bacterium]